MIMRIWRGRAEPTKAPDYESHFTETVAPGLARLAGHRGAWLLRRATEGKIEFLALTLWDSHNSIRAFAGDDIGRAHVEPRARAVLADFDDHATHYEVVFNSP